MSAHTPGPWIAYCRHVNYVEGADWPRDEFLQWEVSGPAAPDGRGDYFQADAHLIAAAPDMHAVLKELAECSQYWSEYDVPLGIHDRIAAALAKAGGQ